MAVFDKPVFPTIEGVVKGTPIGGAFTGATAMLSNPPDGATIFAGIGSELVSDWTNACA